MIARVDDHQPDQATLDGQIGDRPGSAGDMNAPGVSTVFVIVIEPFGAAVPTCIVSVRSACESRH